MDKGIAALQVRLAKRLKLPSINDVLWQQLMQEGYPQAAVNDPAEFDVLVKVAREILKLSPRPDTQTYRPRPRFDRDLYQSERIQALSEYVAKRASFTPGVRHFRATYLGGRTLTDDEADAFLTSPATRILGQRTFEEYGIPYLGHMATIAAEEKPVDKRWEVTVHGQIHIEPPGVTIPFNYSGHPMGMGEGEGPLRYRDKEGWSIDVPDIWPSSVLSELQKLSADLAHYNPWDEYETAWFVLTGDAPTVSPLEIHVRHKSLTHISRSLISMEIEPWLPAQTVMQKYRILQKRLLGGENRPLSMRNLAVLRFVTAQTNDRGGHPSWNDMLEAWNTAHPEDTYDDVRLIERDYRRATVVLNPPFRWQETDADDL